MAATDPQSLYASGNCYACAGVSEVDVMELGLLSLIVKTLNPAVDTSPTALNKLINCFMCFAPGSTAQMYRLALLSLIAQNISGSGGGGSVVSQLITYTAGIPANPSNTALPALAYDPTGNLPLLGWNTGTLTWN